MRIIVGNVKSRIVVGGKDNLLPCNLLKELQEYLRIKQDGYHRSPKYQDGSWDGFTNLITKANYFATGFLPLVVKKAIELGAKVTFMDERVNMPVFKDTVTDEIGNGWKAEGKFIHQMVAFRRVYNFLKVGEQLLFFPRGLLDCATNSGKLAIISVLLNNLVDFKCLYIVDRVNNLEETYNHFNQFLDVGLVCAKDDRRRLNKEAPEFGTQFTLATAGTLSSKMKKSVNVKKELASYDVVVVDEAHRGGSATHVGILKNVKAGCRLFMSGTHFDIQSKYKKLLLVGQAGPSLYKIGNQELIDKGVSVPPKCFIHLNPDNSYGYNAEDEYQKVVIASTHRAAVIAKIINDNPERFTVIPVARIAHGEILLEFLKDKIDVSIDFVHGDHDHRHKLVEDFKQGKIRVLITTSILRESSNIPIIQQVIFAAGKKSPVDFKQWYGRSARLGSAGDYVYWHDFFDQGKTVSKHSRKRIKAILKQEFELNLLYPHNAHYSPKRKTLTLFET